MLFAPANPFWHMKKSLIFLVSTTLIAAGCGTGETADTSPLPPKDTQARVDSATKSVQASNMTPEQKQAADAYLKQGAANAEQIKKSAGNVAGGAPR
jgi:hypothetical protein